MGVDPITSDSVRLAAEAKRTALEAVLNSVTFARSEQLRQFLKYVCQQEIVGHGDSISEYAIGVEALGRPASFAPAEESAVRTRAHALRVKLREYYEREAPGAELRIDLPKGSYVPRFLTVAQQHEVAEEDLATVSGKRTLWIAAVAVALLAGALAMWLALSGPKVPQALRDAWGPLLRGQDEVLLCISTPGHLVVNAVPPGQMPPRAHALPDAEAITPSMLEVFPHWKNSELAAEFTVSSVRLGESFGALAAVRVLTQAGVPYRAAPVKTVGWPAMAGRNLIVLGAPDFSLTARRLLAGAPFSMQYDAAHQEVTIQGGEKLYVPRRDDKAQPVESYGLLTVRPSEGSADRSHRTVVVSGATSAGAQAAMAFFTSPSALENLRSRLGGTFPEAWQVVVRCTADQDVMLEYAYTAHRGYTVH